MEVVRAVYRSRAAVPRSPHDNYPTYLNLFVPLVLSQFGLMIAV